MRTWSVSLSGYVSLRTLVCQYENLVCQSVRVCQPENFGLSVIELALSVCELGLSVQELGLSVRKLGLSV